MKFELNEKERITLEKWKKKIYSKFGEYGAYTYKFSPTGIGNKIEVYSMLLNKKKDITDYSSW